MKREREIRNLLWKQEIGMFFGRLNGGLIGINIRGYQYQKIEI